MPIEEYDFAFVMGALHHSKDLTKTLGSIYGSLKLNGVLIAQEPAMPDSITHDEYHQKYNIVEERFGLKIRNGDRYDRFFRECEYKCALVHSGFDILLWDDFSKNQSYFTKSKLLLPKACETLRKDGWRTLIEKGWHRIQQQNAKNFAIQSDWREKMRQATKDVRPKIFIAQKPLSQEIYH